MKVNVKLLAMVSAAITAVASQAWADNIVTLASGINTITFLPGTGDAGFTSLAQSDLDAAAIGPSVASYTALYAQTVKTWPNTSLGGYPGALWINTNATQTGTGNTGDTADVSALYAVHFHWSYPATTLAKLQINYFTDNALGWRGDAGGGANNETEYDNDYMNHIPLTQGIYLNNTATLFNTGNNRTNFTDLSTADPSLNNFSLFADPAYTAAGQLDTVNGRFQEVDGLSLADNSDNILYLNVSSFASQSGIIFGATISAPVPEPASLGLLLLAAPALLRRRRA